MFRGGLLGVVFAAAACAAAAPSAERTAAFAPAAIPTDRSALEPLTAALRAKVRTLGLNGQPGLGGEKVSRALVLLPADRAKPGVIRFEIGSGERAGVYECEVLGRGRTAFVETPGWLRGTIATTTIWYAPMESENGSTPPGIYDVRNITPSTYEIAFLNSASSLKGEEELVAAVTAEDPDSRPYFSGVWKTWYPRSRRVTPIDMIWSEAYQPRSQGARFPVIERRPKAKTQAEAAFQAKQLRRNPRYYYGPYGRYGLANHTDRWDDPDRRSDPQFASRAELSDFRYRDTDGCLKVRADCLERLNEFVDEQSRLGRRVQYEVRE
ncbi:MAG: hypothetical protein HY553_05430 [Elusimicrobia bacterium]|nr:hypothetical protein [Elusimicrobiota bacterium]